MSKNAIGYQGFINGVSVHVYDHTTYTGNVLDMFKRSHLTGHIFHISTMGGVEVHEKIHEIAAAFGVRDFIPVTMEFDNRDFYNFLILILENPTEILQCG